ncbi:MAG: PD-(D/E)XK nuclease family protein [Elusimicrobia bacterium]|nr:PD-(D/E)XK nuclease family protein [Elusimicrobiota bacterium]
MNPVPTTNNHQEPLRKPTWWSRLTQRLRTWWPFARGVELSFSKLKAYQACPWLYKLMYVDGKRPAMTPHIALGLSIHRALEAYHRLEGRTIDDLLEAYDVHWVNEGFESPQQAMDFYDRGLRILQEYYLGSRERQGDIVWLEQRFEFPLGRHRVRGTIDRVDRKPDGTYEVIDYKTHLELWEQAKVDGDLQLTIYAMACRRALGIEPTHLTYYFLSHGERMTTHRTSQQEAAVIALIKDVGNRVTRQEFSPNLKHCPRCDLRTVCEYGRALKPNRSLQPSRP